VATATRAARDSLDAWAQQVRSAKISIPTIDALMRSLVQTYARGVADTSEAMLVYDALATLQQTRLDKLTFAKQAPDEVDRAVTAELAKIYVSLTKDDPTPIAEITRVQNMTAHLAELNKLLAQRRAGE
jgi:hypothetical protein